MGLLFWDQGDLDEIAKHFGQTCPPAPSEYDFNKDGKIDMVDIAAVAKMVGQPKPLLYGTVGGVVLLLIFVLFVKRKKK